ncbi:SRT1 [Symbiodinium natans]|uniref:Regulatory protein SIR2 homolog 7 n=1 Tax=Symbiodinium natans TaxID=878477 RepID=A0A812TN28_9DINO|nr:SRT1 [Symbiodinium natans]
MKSGSVGEAGNILRITQGKNRKPPKEEVSLRDIDPVQFQVIVRGNAGPLETLDQKLAYMRLHPGAIYLNQQTSYFVEDLDLAKRVAWVVPRDSRRIDYYTECRKRPSLVMNVSTQEEGSGGTFLAQMGGLAFMSMFMFDTWKEQSQTDTTWKSNEFNEYEREFQSYMQQNLRQQKPSEDFASELRDDGERLQEKLRQLVDLWRKAHNAVIFTGAGISTAAGLPDYRGPQGVWTRKLRGEEVKDLDLDRGLQPTEAHRGIARLLAAGRVTFVASTNVDGLHKKAGLPPECLAELHGNSFEEECAHCGRRFERDFVVRTATSLFDHATGRCCEECGGPLQDTIVNFGNTVEHVPSMEAAYDRTWVQCLKADLVVVLGSSLSVPTACDLPEECLQPREGKPDGGQLVIVNLQRTPKDDLASLRLFASCDEVMAFVERNLMS